MLSALLPAEVFAVLLVFVRVGAALMLLPGFGEPAVTPRLRLLLGLLIALLVTPLLEGQLPGLPSDVAHLGLLIAGEVLIGLFLGSMARLFMAALVTAGMMIAYMSSLANALVEDPSAAQQGSIAGSFLNVTALLIIFALDLHHLMLAAVVDSYQLFVPGQALPVGDFTETMAKTVSAVFLLAVQIAAPFIAVGMIFYLGVGLLARLMPQIQVFFIAMPMQIALGIMMLAISLPIILHWFILNFEETLSLFVAGG